MVARNDVTGDAIKTKGASQAYSAGWDAIFGKKAEAEKKDSKDSKEVKETVDTTS